MSQVYTITLIYIKHLFYAAYTLGIYITEKSGLPKEYQGIGVRIEDDVLITVNGPVVLSRKCPKEVDEIEQIVCEGMSKSWLTLNQLQIQQQLSCNNR